MPGAAGRGVWARGAGLTRARQYAGVRERDWSPLDARSGAAADCDASAPPAMATLGLSKVFILDKYFTELQRFWETEKKLQGESSPVPPSSHPRPAPARCRPRDSDDYYFLCRVRRSKAPRNTLRLCVCIRERACVSVIVNQIARKL